MNTFGLNLVVIEGPDRGQTLALTRSPLVIGRGADCDLLLHDQEASRRHAELRGTGTSWQLVDLGSTNGTFAGGQRLAAGVPFPLTAGVTFIIGHTSFVLQPELAAPAAPVIPAAQPVQAAPAVEPPAPAATGTRGAWLAWVCRLIVAAGSVLVLLGAQGDWLRVQVTLPLLGTVADRTFRGIESAYGWLMIEVAVLALLLVLLDIVLRRWALAAGLGELIAALVGAGALGLSAYMFYRVGAIELFGVSLMDIFTQYVPNTIQVLIQTGLVLVGVGLGLMIVGGILRMVVTRFERK